MMGAKFTSKAQHALNRALHLAGEMGHTYIGTEHFLLGLLGERECIASGVLEAGGVSYEAVRAIIRKTSGVGEATELTPRDMTPKAKKIIEDAARESSRVKNGYIGTEHLLYAILSEQDCFGCKAVSATGASVVSIKGSLSVFIAPETAVKKAERGDLVSSPSLSKYGRNLIASAQNGEIDPVIGRNAECERVIQILSRRTKNNPCLIGEPGVGKTAIVEGLAVKIAEGKVPGTLKDKIIVSLDIPAMVAGAKYRGEFEDRMKNVMEEVRRRSDVILFVDEVHTIVGAGAAEGALDGANIIKPALSRGELQMIGATTLEEYRRHIEKDAALERRFCTVTVREPTPAESVSILSGLRDKYEAHHKIRITDSAIGAAVDLSVRYLKDRRLPDKAIDLIDETASRKKIEADRTPPDLAELECRIKEAGAEKKEAILAEDFEGALAVKRSEKELIEAYRARSEEKEKEALCEIVCVTPDDVAKTLTAWTGIPLETVKGSEREELSGLEEKLRSVIVGQDEAISTVCRAVKRGRLGIKDPERPSAVFMFLGPSGVGKTELSKALALALTEDGKGLVRFDMSEFSEKHSVSKLIGSPPGYVGYGDGARLTETVRHSPYSVVLFDEIEKAHHEVLNVLLQINEDGRLTDATGRECDFRNTVIIMTSNVGGEAIASPKCLGFSANEENSNSDARRKNGALNELKKAFSPEFIGRIDEVVLFRPLSGSDLSAIAEKFLQKTSERLSDMRIAVTFDESVSKMIALRAESQRYGARPVRSLAVSLVEDAVTEEIISGRISSGDSVRCYFDGTKIVFEKQNVAGMPDTVDEKPVCVKAI